MVLTDVKAGVVNTCGTTELEGCVVVLKGGTTVVACVVVPVVGRPIGDSLSSAAAFEGPAALFEGPAGVFDCPPAEMSCSQGSCS